MQKVTINPSIAAIVNIDSVGRKEVVPIYFTATADWTGTYEFKLYNSDKKNTTVALTGSNPIAVVDELMTLTVDPTVQGIVANTYYYEITKVEDKRVIFKGNLKVVE
jgi:hypothetical protein